MPYDINQFSPGYGGTINSSGNVVNIADTLDEATGQFKPPAMKQFTFQSGATAIGDGTVQDVSGYNSLVATLTSTGSATIAFEYSMDNVLWVSLPGQIIQNTGANISLNTSLTVTSTVFIRFNIVGLKYVRFRISAYTSGAIGASAVASTGSVQYSLGASLAFGNIDTNAANNTLLGVGAYNLLFDGTNWTRQRGASANGDAINGSGNLATGLWGYNGTTWDRIRTINTGQLRTTVYNSSGTELLYVAPASVTDGSALSSGAGTLVSNVNFGFNGTNFDRVRVGKVYKWNEYLALPTNTSFTVWTPTSTKKIRLMGLSVSVSASCALNVRVGTAGSGTRIATLRFAGAGNYYLDFGNGFLATNATTDVLEINNPASSPTSATVDVHVTAYGTEE